MKMVKIFMSYAHEDEEMKNEIDVHLAPLKRMGKIETWNDREILGGSAWDADIIQQLEDAHIILLLVSPAFNNSQYIWDVEITKALERHEKGEARVIPIILKDCFFQGLPYDKLQALPIDAEPIELAKNRDSAYVEVVKGIHRVVDNLLSK